VKQTVPTLTRLAALWHPGAYGERTMDEMSSEAEVAAKKLGMQL
jgi:putative tryptophan/tyrosine transport system substrate-binding protein